MPKPRQMRLTPELVARVPPHTGETGMLAGRTDRPTDADYEQVAAALLAEQTRLWRDLDFRLRLADLEPRFRL